MVAPTLLWVVIDTSGWVSAILTPSGPPGRIVRAFADGRIQVVMSEYLFSELAEVLERPRIKRRHTGRDDASVLLALLRRRARTVITSGTMRACRDAKDDLILETAVIGGHSTSCRGTRI
jgi:putative PIN family toxin of toxin-antitoxin system